MVSDITIDNLTQLLIRYFPRRMSIRTDINDMQISFLVNIIREKYQYLNINLIENCCKNDSHIVESIVQAHFDRKRALPYSAVNLLDYILSNRVSTWKNIYNANHDGKKIISILAAAIKNAEEVEPEYETCDWREMAEEEERNMDDETDGFWRMQNDYQ